MTQLILSNDLADNIMREFKERIEKSEIHIMKGTMPANAEELDSLTLLSDREDDVLVSFTSTVVSQLDDRTVGIETTWADANKTGAATWFWVRFNDAGEYSHACGTVGLLNSGSDMEIGNVDVSENGKYRVTKLKFKIPMSW